METPELNEQEKALIRDSNDFVGAIKSYRNRTGFGLKESKDIVDAYRYQYRLGNGEERDVRYEVCVQVQSLVRPLSHRDRLRVIATIANMT